MFDAGSNDLTFTPHPLSLNPATAGDAPPPTPGYDPTGFGIPATQVLLLGDDPWFPSGAGLPFSDGADHIISTGALSQGLSYQLLAGALGLAGGITSINGIHMGIVVDQVHLATGDIKPGSDPNSINLGSKGVIPMAVLTDANFDATTIDVSTVTFADQTLDDEDRGLSPKSSALEDVDGDGDLDLTLKFDTQELVAAGFLSEASAEGTIHGLTTGGETFDATDLIRLVPIGDGNHDQIVAADDYTIWANDFGMSGQGHAGDFDEDNKVDAADYTSWANAFGTDYTNLVAGAAGAGIGSMPTITNTDSGGGGGAASVPEPSTFVLTCFGLVALLAYGWRRRK